MHNSPSELIGFLVETKRWKLVGGILHAIDEVEIAKGLKRVDGIRAINKVESGLYIIAKELALYEVALCRIIDEQPDSAAAEIAKAALRNFG
jgi:hypothetical protein